MNDTALNKLNTLGVPSSARAVHRVTSAQALLALAPIARGEGLLVLGGGSNVVLGSYIDQPVCLMRNRGITVVEQAEGTELTVAAGERWHDLVRWSLGNGYAGLENLALIPGSVGAAPVQNIGAYGVELASCFVRLTALETATGQLQTLGHRDCKFGYRTSIFKSEPGKFVIADVTLALGRRGGAVETGYADVALELARMGIDRPDATQVAEAVIRIRRRKLPDPRFVPNVGSFFKNPVIDARSLETLSAIHPDLKSYHDDAGIKLSAAQLIERCGYHSELADFTAAEPDAAVRVWHRQPLVLTNPGHRPASEVLAFAVEIQSSVASTFGIRLELEPDTFFC